MKSVLLSQIQKIKEVCGPNPKKVCDSGTIEKEEERK